MSKQAGLSFAIGLVGVGIILHALPKLGVGPATATAASVAPSTIAGGTTPTIVWYGVVHGLNNTNGHPLLFRAWSDGTVEMSRVEVSYPGSSACDPTFPPCASTWFVISSPTDGLAATADTNVDQVVDGADLANVLAAWGPAPRSPIPPSDCPLDLINP
jgi:hypothetical protein